jgi:parvulin-like peptidyl-prolyl isomerase
MNSREKKQMNRKETAQSGSQTKRSPFVIIGTIIVLVIVVIAFVFVPAIEALVGSSSEPSFTFGSYDGEDITLAYGNYFAEQISAIQQTIPPEQMNNIFAGMQVYQQAFSNTVVHTAKMKEVANAGFIMPNSVVDKEIINLPNFQEDGVFSAALYQSIPNDQKMMIWNSVKEQLISSAYDQSLQNMRVSTKELEFINAMNNAVRSFELASLPLSAYPDSEVRVYAESNPDLFKQIHLSVITINSSERDANNLLASVNNGTSSFEDAARNSSSDSYANAGGDMGLKIVYELNAEIPEETQQSIFSLAKGALSSVIEVPNGWAFYRMEEPAKDLDLNNADNLAKVRTYIQGYERGRMENWLMDRADAFVVNARADGFTAAVSAAFYEGFTSSSFGPVPVNYGDNELFTKVTSFNVSELNQAASNENFWTQAFKTPINSVSDPMIVGDNVIILYPTSETSASTDGSETGTDSFLDMYYPYWMNFAVNQNVTNQILQSDKLVDNFTNTYIGLIQ